MKVYGDYFSLYTAMKGEISWLERYDEENYLYCIIDSAVNVGVGTLCNHCASDAVSFLMDVIRDLKYEDYVEVEAYPKWFGKYLAEIQNNTLIQIPYIDHYPITADDIGLCCDQCEAMIIVGWDHGVGSR